MIVTAAFETVSALLAVMSPIALPEPQDCRAITEPSKRLACYDARNTPTEPAIARLPAAPPRRPSIPPVSSYVPPAASIVADRTGRIVTVERLRYGRYRVALDDGRAFLTSTNTAAPPRVGESVSLRRSAIGTTFLDIRGRQPITVRPTKARRMP